jgi:hypothetical protein
VLPYAHIWIMPIHKPATRNSLIVPGKCLFFFNQEHIHMRVFPLYVYKMMNLSLEFDSSEPTDSMETLVGEIVTRLLRLGSYLNEASKIQYKKEIVDNVHEQHPEYLPNQSMKLFRVFSQYCDNSEAAGFHNKLGSTILI